MQFISYYYILEKQHNGSYKRIFFTLSNRLLYDYLIGSGKVANKIEVLECIECNLMVFGEVLTNDVWIVKGDTLIQNIPSIVASLSVELASSFIIRSTTQIDVV